MALWCNQSERIVAEGRYPEEEQLPAAEPDLEKKNVDQQQHIEIPTFQVHRVH